ncbi:MFS transporter [Planotetraspora thailandica]|uniref:MFS transporter n=1 Tax=Planotetraspora thailandica TaxID=487172 RepID=A0A8J3XWB5_9ACTN|nr:MFS transporter [Planotetraspora thailandica]GII57427.1 MFS transporter [Planotetraspora thailandica]
MAEDGAEPAVPLRGNRGFLIFLVVQTLSSAGDSFSLVALPLLVLHTTGSVTQMGLVTALAGAAAIVSGMFAGVLADRADRRRLLIACDALRAVLYAVVPLAWVLAGPQMWLIYLVVPLGAALGMVFQVTYVAVVPALVDESQIMTANSRLYGAYAVAGVAGPALAGTVSALTGPAGAIAVDAATFAVSAAGLCLVRLRTRASSPSVPVESRTSVVGGFLAGVRFLWRHPVLRALTVLLSVLTFVTHGMTDVVIYHLKHDLEQPDTAAGYVLAVATAGTLAAALLAPRVRRTLGFGVSWIGAWAVCGVAAGGIGLATSVPLVALLTSVYLFCTATAGISSMTLRQEVTPDALLGRVTSAFWTVHSALGPIGAAALTFAAGRWGVAVAAPAAGLVCVLIAVCATLTPVRSSRPEQLSGEAT